MQENEPVDKKRNTTSPPRGGPPRKNLSRTFEERLRAVKLHLEEGFTQEMVVQEMGVSSAAVYKWVARYRLQSEAALKSQLSGGPERDWPHRSVRARGQLIITDFAEKPPVS